MEDKIPVDCPTDWDSRVGKDSMTARSLPGSLRTEDSSRLKKMEKKNC